MTLNIPLSPEDAALLKARAAAAGKDVETFVREVIEERLAAGEPARDPRSVDRALSDLDGLRVGNRLNGLTIRQLIDEGRRANLRSSCPVPQPPRRPGHRKV